MGACLPDGKLPLPIAIGRSGYTLQSFSRTSKKGFPLQSLTQKLTSLVFVLPTSIHIFTTPFIFDKSGLV
jgi:hypothetical protein